jgi:hypothetical protein
MNTNQVKAIGIVGLKIGKAVVIEGVKAVMLNAAASTITSSFEDGFDGVKKLKLNEFLHGRDKLNKKKLFKRKNKKQKEGFKATILNADGSTVADVDIDIDDLSNINMDDVKVAE